MMLTGLLVFLSTDLLLLVSSERPIVNVNGVEYHGRYETFNTSSGTHSVDAYLGIPYAEPPIGSMRFERPMPYHMTDSWYDATGYQANCVQMQDSMATKQHYEDEDCLYLNVFVPEAEPDEATGFAVMVWVHGGGFLVGSAYEYHSPHFAETGNVILVTINYRLSVFGFLQANDSHFTGNYGLYDQALALQWVHDHISYFNGDTKRVTIFGGSAGAMSVAFQGLYPNNYGRFQRIIAQSGSAFIPSIDVNKDNKPGIQLLAKSLECPIIPLSQAVECMKGYTWLKIKTTYIQLTENPLNMALLDFSIRIDGDMVKVDPKSFPLTFDEYTPDEISFFKSLDFLTGVNKFEGGLLLQFYTYGQSDYFYPSRDELMTSYIPNMMRKQFGFNVPEAVNQVMLHEYTNWANPESPEALRVEYVKALGDMTFVAPAVRNARYNFDYDKSEKTFVYRFLPFPSERQSWSPNWLPGADHSDELMSLFNQTFATEWERTLSDKMIKYWVNFAKSGNPNYPGSVDVYWPAYTMDEQSYLELDKDMGWHSVKHYFATRTEHFVQHVLPGMMDTGDSSHDGCDGWTAGAQSVARNTVTMVTMTGLGLWCSWIWKFI